MLEIGWFCGGGFFPSPMPINIRQHLSLDTVENQEHTVNCKVTTVYIDSFMFRVVILVKASSVVLFTDKIAV